MTLATTPALPPDNLTSPMTFGQGQATQLANSFNRIVNDISAQGTTGQPNVQSGSTLAKDINNAEALVYYLGENGQSASSGTNAPAKLFLSGAYNTLVNFQQQNTMGHGNLSKLMETAKNVVTALMPNVTGENPAPPPPATTTGAGGATAPGGAPVGGASGGTPVGTAPGGAPVGAPGQTAGLPGTGAAGFDAVTNDLQNEANASTSAGKAQFVSQAIDDLIAALGGSPASAPQAGAAGGGAAPAPGTTGTAAAPGAPPAAGPTAPSADAPSIVSTAAGGPVSSGAMAPNVATDLLKATKTVSGLVQQSSAPEAIKSSLQNSLANMVGTIANDSKIPALQPATSNPNLTKLLNLLKEASALVPQSGLSDGVNNQLEDGLAGLVGNIAKSKQSATPTAASLPTQKEVGLSILQGLRSIMNEIKPYLNNSAANNQSLDLLAQQLEQTAMDQRHA